MEAPRVEPQTAFCMTINGHAVEPPVLPAFVVAEVEAFLRCGLLSHGLVQAKCRDWD